MRNSYEDITSKIDERPSWWDWHGVPRYEEHHPRLCPDIYAREVALLLIGCQACGHRFEVQMSWKPHPLLTHHAALEGMIRSGVIHYGDPPNAGCCAAGPTMNCDDLRVLQFWRNDKSTGYDWARVPELEIALPDQTHRAQGELP